MAVWSVERGLSTSGRGGGGCKIPGVERRKGQWTDPVEVAPLLIARGPPMFFFLADKGGAVRLGPSLGVPGGLPNKPFE